MVRCVAGQYDVAVIEQFVATVVKANVWFRQEGNKTLCDFKRCRHVACMVKSTARPAVKRVASRMHSAHVVSTGGHGNLGFANRADQRVIDVNVDNELAIQRAPRSHNMVIYDSLSDKLSSITVVVDFLGKCQIF